MEHKIEQKTDRELIIRTDQNKLVRLKLVRPNENYGLNNMAINDYGTDLVIYSENKGDGWAQYPPLEAESLLHVVHANGIKIQDLTIDFFVCNIFTQWYRSL